MLFDPGFSGRTDKIELGEWDPMMLQDEEQMDLLMRHDLRAWSRLSGWLEGGNGLDRAPELLNSSTRPPYRNTSGLRKPNVEVHK